jgi:hypothetical protein
LRPFAHDEAITPYWGEQRMQHCKFSADARRHPALVYVVAILSLASVASAHARRHDPKIAAPVISGAPAASDVAGQQYSFTPTASDPSGYTLTFSISGKPAWATFNTSSGQLAGTPATANVGTYSNIIITVRGGVASASLAPFSITVSSPPNVPPTISGQPATSINVATPYSFTPTASDTDGDPLTFSIQNEPSWAGFSTATGQLSGTPAAGDVGTYSNIIISVSDGVSSVSLAPFTVTVNQISTGSATVTWIPPTQNTDGTTLTNLAGYKIYYGTAPGSLTQSIQLSNVGLTSYMISNLSTATWYFGMTAYTSSGAESTISNIASKTVQ